MIMGLEGSGTAITADAVKVKLLQEIKTSETKTDDLGEAAFLTKTNTKQTKGTRKIGRCYVS